MIKFVCPECKCETGPYLPHHVDTEVTCKACDTQMLVVSANFNNPLPNFMQIKKEEYATKMSGFAKEQSRLEWFREKMS